MNEYIKHLRLIHFSLVVLCFGCVVGVLLSNKEIDNALEEFRALNNVNNKWNSEWLNDYRDSLIAQGIWKASEIKDSIYVEFCSKIVRLNLQSNFPLVDIQIPKNLIGDYYREKDLIKLIPETKSGFFSSSDLKCKRPENLLEFSNMWNRLNRKVMAMCNLSTDFEQSVLILKCFNSEYRVLNYFPIPAVIRNSRKAENIVDTVISVSNISYYKTSDLTSPFKEIIKEGRLSSSRYFTAPFEKSYILETRIDELPVKCDVTTLIGNDCYSTYRLSIGYPYYSFHLFSYPIHTSYEFHLQDAFNISMNSSFFRGNFSYTFPALNGLTEKFGHYKISDIYDVLLLLKSQRPEKLEAFGLSIPSSQIVYWGSLIILILQTYFLLHARAFKRKQFQSDAIIAIPWIGIYEDRLSNFVTITTASIFPVATVVFLQLREFYSISTVNYINWSVLLSFILFGLFLTWSSMVVLRAIWLKRRSTIESVNSK